MIRSTRMLQSAFAGALLLAGAGYAQDGAARVAPAIAAYTDGILLGDVWRRPDLSPRDRSLVTLAVLIATGRTGGLEAELGRALDNGVTPLEASGVLTHLAVYAGWPSAEAALPAYEAVYAARGVDTASLGAALPPLPLLASDPGREQAIADEFGPMSAKLAELTNGLVFGDLWRRSDLSTRDRSLVTIAALAAMGDDDVLAPYLNRGVEAGLTREEIAEALLHLAFYAGWPKAVLAIRAVAATLEAPAPD